MPTLRLVISAVTPAFIALAMGVNGCTTGLPLSGSGKGKVVVLLHDANATDFKNVFLTVNSVTLLSDSGQQALALRDPVRVDLLSLTDFAQVLTAAEVPTGTYSKIRLQVSDPLFVLTDGTEVPASDIQLVANGMVDLNTQDSPIVVPDGQTVVLSLDLNAKNSIQITTTGSSKYILRPQVFVDASVSPGQKVVLDGATITAVDLTKGQLTIKLADGSTLVVLLNSATVVVDSSGLPLTTSSLTVNATVQVEGVLNLSTNEVIAAKITVESS